MKSWIECVPRRLCSTLPATHIKDSTDEDLLHQLKLGKLKSYRLEEELEDTIRAARLRKIHALSEMTSEHAHIGSLKDLPLDSFDSSRFFDSVHGVNCENVVGFIALPVGLVGPLLINDKPFMVPLATTEGALVASTNRGARAIALSGGSTAIVLKDGMTRAPIVALPSIKEAAALKFWLENSINFKKLQTVFNATSRFGKLESVHAVVAGRTVHMRFSCITGDAMGMNMVSKGINAVMAELSAEFPQLHVQSLSGNYCTDKKPSAVNWILGRGKSVVAETILKGSVIKDILKTNAAALVNLNIDKNLIGSSLAGGTGGNNAHAANMVAAIFLATGQDPAQVVESANCMTLMEAVNDEDLHVSVTMPCIEVGTVGGGTGLYPQAANLDLLGVRGANKISPGRNSSALAMVIASTVLAGEISLMAAHTAGHLVSAHMKLGRQKDSSNKAKVEEVKVATAFASETSYASVPSLIADLNKKSNNDFPRLPTP